MERQGRDWLEAEAETDAGVGPDSDSVVMRSQLGTTEPIGPDLLGEPVDFVSMRAVHKMRG